MDWHARSADETLVELGSSSKGLSSAVAEERLKSDGPNALAEAKRESRALKLLKQFTEFIILVLIGAAVIAGVLGEIVDAIAILAIVALNGAIGFLQEEKAERVLDALKKMSAPNARAYRDSALSTVPASALVKGDVVALEAGDKVPADCRIIEASRLKVEEAALTGESHPVDKTSAALAVELPLADRLNMLYMGTTVVYGRALAVVASTGMSTEMGRIARLLQEVKPEPTPLQRKLAEFGRRLVYVAGFICALIFLLGVLRGEALLEMFLTAVSLAVAAIPEGLPAVVTIVLALGVQRMVKKHALIRKLPSVETLGAATIIASDKTGTITQNQMTVRRVYLGTGLGCSVAGAGYAPDGAFHADGRTISPLEDHAFSLLLRTALLCTNAEIKRKEKSWEAVGDPTEAALVCLAVKAGLNGKQGVIDSEGLTFAAELPFDADRKMMSVVFADRDGGRWVCAKGAVESILPRSTRMLAGGGQTQPTPLTHEQRGRISAAGDLFSSEAMRVLAIAYKRVDGDGEKDVEGLESDLVFLGLVGMIDPPREEVFVAVEKARAAGIVPLMITGDHKATAVAIATEIGAFRHGDEAVTGQELDAMSDEEFAQRLGRIRVYARVNPEHKLKIVRAWRARGEIIAMTGDGVNDAPALKEADIGVAMGIAGTDVTKEAADMVLTDDNFASIVSAVEEGRGVFDNIRRVVHFLLSCNIGEILVLLAASLMGMPLPLLPVQILWTNLVTDGLPALGLAMEKVDPGVMERMPRPKNEGIVTKRLLYVMLIQGALMAMVTLGAYAVMLYGLDATLEKARTMAFTVLVLSQKFHVYNCRSAWRSAFTAGFFSNMTLNAAVALIIISQALLLYVPSLQKVFNVVPLGIYDWAIAIVASVLPLLLMEVIKWIKRGANAGAK